MSEFKLDGEDKLFIFTFKDNWKEEFRNCKGFFTEETILYVPSDKIKKSIEVLLKEEGITVQEIKIRK